MDEHRLSAVAVFYVTYGEVEQRRWKHPTLVHFRHFNLL